METNKMSRNGSVDIIRLIFAGFLMMSHFYSNGAKHFPGGYFCVEFFVVLAGFLLFFAWDQKGISRLGEEERRQYWLNYMKKRYIRFFWYGLIAFTFAFFVMRIWRDRDFAVGDRLAGDIWEILLVKMAGLNRGGGIVNGPAWTLECMLFAEFFILGMLAFWERPFLSMWMPLSVVFGIGYLANNYTSLGTVATFFTHGMLRVYVLTCFGIFSYWICKKIKALAFSKSGRWILTGAELCGYIILVLIVLYRNGVYYQFCFVLIETVVLAVSFSTKSFAGSQLPANKLTNFCAELSLGLYLTHWPVLAIFRYLYEDVNDLYRQKFIFLFSALAAALIYTFIMQGVFKMLPMLKSKLKSILLEQI